jgi:hypothetical protein
MKKFTRDRVVPISAASVAVSAMLPKAAAAVARRRVRYGPILLQKSQNALDYFSRQTTKQAAIAD